MISHIKFVIEFNNINAGVQFSARSVLKQETYAACFVFTDVTWGLGVVMLAEQFFRPICPLHNSDCGYEVMHISCHLLL
jgi:hypothetical protein